MALALVIAIGGIAAAAQVEATDGLARVTGIAASEVLNLRSGPGVGYGIIGALSIYTDAKLLDCRMVGNSRWCQVELLTDKRERGWVNARYLSAADREGPGKELEGTAAQFDAMVSPCIAQASRVTGSSNSAVEVLERIQTGGGPILTLRAAGTSYTCRLERSGAVTVFSEFAN